MMIVCTVLQDVTCAIYPFHNRVIRNVTSDCLNSVDMEATRGHFVCVCVCVCPVSFQPLFYIVGSKSFRPDQLFKVTEIKQLCYFST